MGNCSRNILLQFSRLAANSFSHVYGIQTRLVSSYNSSNRDIVTMPSEWTHRLALEFTICPAISALCTIQNSSTSWARQQSALNSCASPESACARDTVLTTPTTPCRRKDHPRVPLEETPRAARKRPHSHIELDDDIALPSRADKFPRAESDRSIPRSPGSVLTSTPS